MLSSDQQASALRRLKELAEEQEADKNIKSKIKNVSKLLNDKLKILSQQDGKKVCDSLSKINEQYLCKFLTDLENKNRYLMDSQEKLKTEKDTLNREKMNALEDKERLDKSIIEIKETISKMEKAIDESVKQEKDKRKKIEEDLDKSIAEIKEKISTFEKQSAQMEEQNKALREKKQGFISKMSGLEEQFKNKAGQKDQIVKKEKQDLMVQLKEVQNQVNEATQLNKQYAALQKKNFDNKLSIFLRTKKFPELCNSMQNSALTIEKCKQQLTKGVHRLQKAIQITKACEAQSKQINQECINKLKIQSQKQQKLKEIKSEKEQVRQRILDLQNQKKQRQEATKTAN